jgi:serine/threonine protein kinase/Tfp pilus assembly protein PilF
MTNLQELVSASGLSGEQTARVLRVLEGYLTELERGTPPHRDELLARHPDLADLLAEYLDKLDQLHEAAAGLRAAPPGEERPTAPLGEHGRLGDFDILREVGRGGMGIVYEAEQVSLGRRVALKVLPFAATLDPRQLQRFHNEARAAASLHHEHIVPVYAVGCERAVHFYAMQFIEGKSLAQLIAAQRQTPASGVRQPSATTAAAAPTEAPRDAAYLRRIAGWGIQAAEALEHAHALGIVHRDVKPANLIVDGQGKLWVTDFGLARTMTDAGLTMTGDLLGTLRYMSPEQALARHGLMDHRTDIYSLGATLYELLTGRPAVEGQDRQEILRRIADEEPRPPRALDGAVPADLEIIVLKALAKEPTERYATARELADDLRRFLEGRPILARPPSFRQVVTKWARRHRTAVTAAAVCLLVSLTTLLAGMVWHNARLHAEAAKTAHQRDRARDQKRQARQAVDDMYTQVAEKWLANEPGMTDVQREFLEKAQRYYESLSGEDDDGPEQLLERAQANKRLGAILRRLGRRAEAESAYRRAIALAEGVPGADALAAQAEAHSGLGTCSVLILRFGEAEDSFRRALALWESLPDDAAARPDLRFGQAETLASLSSVYLHTDRCADAERVLQRVLPMLRGLAEASPRESRYPSLLGNMLNNYALAVSKQGDAERARVYLEEAVRHQEEAVKLDPRNPNNRLSLRNHYATLAIPVLISLKRYPEALAAARKSVDLGERLVNDFPNVTHYQRCLADAYDVLCSVLRATNKPAEAEQALCQAVKVQEQVLDADPDSPPDRQQAAGFYATLGDLRWAAGRSRDAVASYRKALAFDPKKGPVSNNLAWLLALGAEPNFNDPAELIRLARTAAEGDLRDGVRWVTLGLALYRSGAWAEAKAALGKASDLSPINDAMRGLVLAMTEWRLNDRTAARAAYDQAVKRLGKDRQLDNEARVLLAESSRLLEMEGKR